MKRNWWMLLLGTSMAVALATGCVVDSGTEMGGGDEETIDSVGQEEVTACPGFASQIPNVQYEKELVITDTNVVDDKCRTIFNNPLCTDPNKSQINGKWSFWYLMSQVAGTTNVTDVSRFILKWLETFEDSSIVVNNQTLEARPKIRNQVIDPWRSESGCVASGKKVDDPVGGSCNLNPTRAPFRLLAILNRVDLRAGGPGSTDPYGNVSSGGDAGEGRFVFGFTNTATSDNTVASTNPLSDAVMILEYKLPTNSRSAQVWAQDWRALGNFSSFNASYSSALQTITERFAKSGVNPGGVNNGSAISQVRSDERQFDVHNVTSQKVWSMREFRLCPKGQSCSGNNRLLLNDTTAQTPPTKLQIPGFEVNASSELDAFLDANEAAILGGTHVIPAEFMSVEFLAGDARSPAAVNGAVQWNRVDQNDYFDMNGDPNSKCTARRLMAFSTCNGCHYLETDTGQNLHIPNRATGSPAAISNFLKTQILPGNDPCEFSVKYDEPLRRKCELLALAAGTSGPITTTTGRPH